MISKLLAQIKSQSVAQNAANSYRNLIRQEAVIGGSLFGPVPQGHRREFFCLDEHSWVWHEEWVDNNAQKQVVTTRYDVRPTGIVKMQGGVGYTAVSPTEASHFSQAVDIYYKRVSQELYGLTV
jgi:hypothetical protein